MGRVGVVDIVRLELLVSGSPEDSMGFSRGVPWPCLRGSGFVGTGKGPLGDDADSLTLD